MPSLLGGATPTRGGERRGVLRARLAGPRARRGSSTARGSSGRALSSRGRMRSQGGRRGLGRRRAEPARVRAFYLEALATLPEVNVHIVPPDDPVAQLSSDLLERASLVGDAAISFLVSEDSRLVDTVRQCKALGHRCGVGIPSASFHRQFQEHAAFYKRIRKRALMASLLDDPIQSARGPLSKPRSW